MNIDPSDAAAHQRVRFNERQCLFVVYWRRLGKAPEKPENLRPALQRAARKLAEDERMTEHALLQQKAGEMLIDSSEMVDPDRRVNENHAGLRRIDGRRRGTARAVLSEPPNEARRFALSRATRASRPARTTAVFSRRPLSCVARLNNASSMLRVVLICISMPI